jgi:hypothetical protein
VDTRPRGTYICPFQLFHDVADKHLVLDIQQRGTPVGDPHFHDLPIDLLQFDGQFILFWKLHGLEQLLLLAAAPE